MSEITLQMKYEAATKEVHSLLAERAELASRLESIKEREAGVLRKVMKLEAMVKEEVIEMSNVERERDALEVRVVELECGRDSYWKRQDETADRYRTTLEEMKNHEIGVCESPKYVQASMYHKFKEQATTALAPMDAGDTGGKEPCGNPQCHNGEIRTPLASRGTGGKYRIEGPCPDCQEDK